jgi:hypothetical protein
MTLIFNKKSWHYRLILWTFGENFFMNTDKIDWPKVESMKGDDLKEIAWQSLPRIAKPKTVNLCPYCRALIGAALTAPVLYIYRLFPHKKSNKPMTIEQIRKNSRRRTWISLGIAATINAGFGIKNVLSGDEAGLITGLIQIAFGLCFLTGNWWGQYLVKAIVKLSALIPQKKQVKKSKESNPKKVHKTLAKIAEKHDIICPPIFFVDMHKPEELK